MVQYDFCGLVVDYDAQSQLVTVQQRNHFKPGVVVEFFGPGGTFFRQIVGQIWDEHGIELDAARHPLQLIKFRVEQSLKSFDMMRKQTGKKQT
jgi:putative protease